MKILGTILILLFITAIIACYHRFTQEIYDDCMKQELEERFDAEIDFRWRNQDIRIRQQFVIVDEMRSKK